MNDDLMIGQLIAGLAANTDAVKDLAESLKDLNQAHNAQSMMIAELRKDVQAQAEDIKEIRKVISSNEHVKPLLLSLGLTPDNPDETRKKIEFVERRQEEVDNAKKNWGIAKGALIVALTVSLAAFCMNTFIDGFHSGNSTDNAKQAVSIATQENIVHGK